MWQRLAAYAMRCALIAAIYGTGSIILEGLAHVPWLEGPGPGCSTMNVPRPTLPPPIIIIIIIMDVSIALLTNYPCMGSLAALYNGINTYNVDQRLTAPYGCQLATMALQIKAATIPKGGLHGRSCRPIRRDVTASGPSCRRLVADRTFSHLGLH